MKGTPASRIERAVRNPAVITKALAKGIRAALERHGHLGQRVVVFRNGRTVWVEPGEVVRPLRRPTSKSQAGR